MSLVSNVVFSFNILEKETDNGYELVEKINQWLNEVQFDPKGLGKEICEFNGIGGIKGIETPLYVAGFNYLNVKEFIEYIKSLSWIFPDDVQLFIQGQEDDKFTLYEPFSGR